MEQLPSNVGLDILCYVKINSKVSDNNLKNSNFVSGCYWSLHPRCIGMFEDGSYLRRRKRFKADDSLLQASSLHKYIAIRGATAGPVPAGTCTQTGPQSLGIGPNGSGQGSGIEDSPDTKCNNPTLATMLGQSLPQPPLASQLGSTAGVPDPSAYSRGVFSIDNIISSPASGVSLAPHMYSQHSTPVAKLLPNSTPSQLHPPPVPVSSSLLAQPDSSATKPNRFFPPSPSINGPGQQTNPPFPPAHMGSDPLRNSYPHFSLQQQPSSMPAQTSLLTGHLSNLSATTPSGVNLDIFSKTASNNSQSTSGSQLNMPAAPQIPLSQQSQSSQTPGSNPAIITNPAVGSANPSQNPVANYLSSAAALELNRNSLIGMSIPSMHPIGSPYHNYNSQNTSLQVPNPTVTGAITPHTANKLFGTQPNSNNPSTPALNSPFIAGAPTVPGSPLMPPGRYSNPYAYTPAAFPPNVTINTINQLPRYNPAAAALIINPAAAAAANPVPNFHYNPFSTLSSQNFCLPTI